MFIADMQENFENAYFWNITEKQAGVLKKNLEDLGKKKE